MALVEKQTVDLSKSSLKIFESTFSKTTQNNNDKNRLFPYIKNDSVQKINYAMDKKQEKQNVDFKHLEWLLDIDKNSRDKNEAHQTFMDNYRKIFREEKTEKDIKDDKKKIWLRLQKNKEDNLNQSKIPKLLAIKDKEKNEEDTDEIEIDSYVTDTHNIGLYLEKIHKKTEEIVDPHLKKIESLKKLRKILKKYPFERNDEDNIQIYEIIKTYDEFTSLFSPTQREDKLLLQKLCGYAQLETVANKETPVFGNFAFYLIIKGSVKPLSIPHMNQFYMKLRNVTPEPPDNGPILGPGSCFGTITHLHGREMTTRMFRVLTLEDKCEFLKISINSYEKIAKKITDEETDEKIQAIRNCVSYKSWPKHTIEELMEIFEWKYYSANTILTSEGYRCPFIGFINKGECHVLRKVDVPFFNKKTGKKEKRMKQVVIGKLKENDSFGEVSVTLKEPMTCSIVTETPCRLGVIPYDKISRLDNITLRLLLQTCSRNFADLTQQDIYEKFIEQEKKKEWKDFKGVVVKDVMSKYGITTGLGKFKTASLDEVVGSK